MIRLMRSQVQPIGLDLGYDGIKMLQLEVIGQSLSVLAAAKRATGEATDCDPIGRLERLGETIRRMLKQGGFSGRHVVTSLPREIVHTKNLRLPQMPLDELTGAVEFEAAHLFPFDPAEARIHFIPAGEVRQGSDVKQEVVVVASRHDDVDAYVEQMHACGLVIDSLDLEACALYRTVDRFVRRKEDEQTVHVLVDVGLRRSQVVIGRGREINFIKPIEVGGIRIHEAVARKLGISLDEARALRRRLVESGVSDAAASDPVRQAVYDAARGVVEELAREISLCLRYYSVTFRGHRPARLRVHGGEACDPQILAQLNTGLPIPAEPARPLLSIDISRMAPGDRRGTLSEWSTALGLALRSTKGTYGARDGAPRDPNAPRPDLAAPAAEVIDLGRAVERGSAVTADTDDAVAESPADSEKPTLEPSHA